MDSYNSSNIDVLEGLDPVKVRPGMYTDTSRPNHLAQEIIDNSVDEAIAKHANKIIVSLTKDNTLSVEDNGRGMPVDIHPEYGIPGIEIILTKLHSGGKFSKKSYDFSGGLHGVGISVVNALSDLMQIEVYRDGKAHSMEFSDGIKTKDLVVIGDTDKRGTKVTFHPNKKYFDSENFSTNKLIQLLKTKAVLCPGLRIVIEIEGEETVEFYFENGMVDYFQDLVQDLPQIPEKEPFTFEIKGEGHHCSLVLTFPDEGPQEVGLSYVNLIPTPLGGTHVNAVKAGVVAAVKEIMETFDLIPKGVNITPDDVWNCNYLISIKLSEPSFAGQTKERLSNKEFAGNVTTSLKDALMHEIYASEALRDAIVTNVINRALARQKAKRKVARKKVVSGPVLPGKLSDCTSTDFEQTEVFIVEGDSAGGSAKQARSRETQAILPLRGKILNTWEVDADSLTASKEIENLSIAIGVEPGDDELKGLRYNKICILADADTDGLHIATLICALFTKHYPALIEKGHVFIAQPPLYRIDIGKASFYALDEAEKDKILADNAKEKGKVSIQRFKGLGEMNPEQLRETVMNKENRRLLRLRISDLQATDSLMDMLLGKKNAGMRRTWLEKNGDKADLSN